MPDKMRRQTATSAARPIPCRQCTAMFLPLLSCSASLDMCPVNSVSDEGTPLSTIGIETKSMSLARHSASSSSRLSSACSSRVSKETTTSTPAPGLNFVLEPIAAARTRHDGQSPRPRSRYPVQFRSHGVFRSWKSAQLWWVRDKIFGMISRGKESTSTPRSRRTLMRWLPSTTVPSGRTLSDPCWPGFRELINS